MLNVRSSVRYSAGSRRSSRRSRRRRPRARPAGGEVPSAPGPVRLQVGARDGVAAGARLQNWPGPQTLPHRRSSSRRLGIGAELAHAGPPRPRRPGTGRGRRRGGDPPRRRARTGRRRRCRRRRRRRRRLRSSRCWSAGRRRGAAAERERGLARGRAGPGRAHVARGAGVAAGAAIRRVDVGVDAARAADGLARRARERAASRRSTRRRRRRRCRTCRSSRSRRWCRRSSTRMWSGWTGTRARRRRPHTRCRGRTRGRRFHSSSGRRWCRRSSIRTSSGPPGTRARTSRPSTRGGGAGVAARAAVRGVEAGVDAARPALLQVGRAGERALPSRAHVAGVTGVAAGAAVRRVDLGVGAGRSADCEGRGARAGVGAAGAPGRPGGLAPDARGEDKTAAEGGRGSRRNPAHPTVVRAHDSPPARVITMPGSGRRSLRAHPGRRGPRPPARAPA